MEKVPLVLIVGPTAVGKSDLAIRLAERLRGEIVSADSRLFYRGMDIGTAKPSKADRARVPHHLIDIADPDQTLSLADFQRLAQQAIIEIHSKGMLPLLVGGTGQYIRAVTEGWRPPAVAPDIRLRAALEHIEQSSDDGLLYRALQAMDPEASAKILPSNTRRTVRALEVILKTGRRFSEQRSTGEAAFRLVTIGLRRTRPEIYARVDARIEAMFSAGLLQEVQGLLAQGYAADLPSMSAIGYAQCIKVARGEMRIEVAKAEIRRLTRIFVRRQANWFRESDPTIAWFDAADPAVSENAQGYLRHSLSIS